MIKKVSYFVSFVTDANGDKVPHYVDVLVEGQTRSQWIGPSCARWMRLGGKTRTGLRPDKGYHKITKCRAVKILNGWGLDGRALIAEVTSE